MKGLKYKGEIIEGGDDTLKKITTLFERVFENYQKVGILPNVTPGMEWVLTGEGIATEKMDGSCCAIIDGVFYKRYDAKRGKTPPVGAIQCCEPEYQPESQKAAGSFLLSLLLPVHS